MIKIRTYLDVRYDVTDLSDNERGALALEVQAMAEESGDSQDKHWHPPVEVEIEWNECEVEEPDNDWRVGGVGVGMIRVPDRAAVDAALAGIQLVDPEGVRQGLYYADPPNLEDDAESFHSDQWMAAS